MEFYPSDGCYAIVKPLLGEVYNQQVVSVNLTRENVSSLFHYCLQTQSLELENKYSKPMVWIGIYIAVASILCIIAMGADLLHGFRNKKMWFPSKYFTLNAASITVITVAMKLPVDLNTYMPEYLDQATKVGSMTFMCTMMANLMPSLASMDNNTLLANVIGMAILVITIVVNICIEINTSVIDSTSYIVFSTSQNIYISFIALAYIYVVVLLWLLLIMISSAITIPSSKRILDFKYKVVGKRTLNNQDNLTSMVEKLRQYIRRYWVMAESGSPQFVMASNPLSSTCGIICVIGLVLELPIILACIHNWNSLYYAEGTGYTWSIFFIAITQSIGVVVGSIAPIFRCFTIINFKLFTKWNMKCFMVFKVEKYWNQKLCDWKESHVTFLSYGSWSRTIIRNFRNLLLGLCIGIQKVIIISSKMMGLIPSVIVILVMYCSYCWKSLVARLSRIPMVVRKDNVNQDLSDYVLQLEDEQKLDDTMLTHISNAVNNLIQKANKEQSKDLLVFLDTSTGFKGVENFDNHQVEHVTYVKLVNSWSLPVVTLTCIAISLPNISRQYIDSLLKNVREGLLYTHHVEEILNDTSEYGNIQKAAMTLWHGVEEKCMWLENTIGESAFRGKTSVEILEWFANKGEEIVLEINNTMNGEVIMVNAPEKLILANSMYRSAKTILFSYQTNLQMISEDDQLFALLSNMIADIFCACFTNIPQVIEMKCRENAIEKRESSVKAAAKLFGTTEEILKRLEVRELPNIDYDKMGFIDEWRLQLKQSFP